MTAHVNSPSSATGVTRNGKKTSRLFPSEGDQFRAVAPQPRSESAGGADTSPEGDPFRCRGQCRESGDADGRATPGRELELAAAIRRRNFPQPDEGQTTEFTQSINQTLPKLVSINKKMAWTIVNNRVLSDSDFSKINVIREFYSILF